MVLSVTLCIDREVLMAQLDGLIILCLLLEDAGDAAETTKPNRCICAVSTTLISAVSDSLAVPP